MSIQNVIYCVLPIIKKEKKEHYLNKEGIKNDILGDEFRKTKTIITSFHAIYSKSILNMAFQ